MAQRDLKTLLTRAKRTPGKLVVLEITAPHLDLSALKLFAEKGELGRGIILYAVSPDFRGKSLVERNEVISEILDEQLTDREMEQISHLFTFTPREFRPSVRKALISR
ncbi:MAG: hypothetical protein V3U28_02335 [Candidatus Acidoferrales bacterium]